MKVHWLNAEMTEAIVTKGWFRKRSATVEEREWEKNNKNYWFFKGGTGTYVGDPLHDWLNDRRTEAKRDINWQPVRSLPPARVVGK